MEVQLSMAVGLLLVTALLDVRWLRPPFCALGLLICISFVFAFLGGNGHACCGEYFANPYRYQQAVIVAVLVIAYGRWRRACPKVGPFVRRLTTTATTATFAAAALSVLAPPQVRLGFVEMATGASAVLTLSLLLEVRLAHSPIARAIALAPRSEQGRDQPGGGLTEPRA
ncbi:MAG: hypothetical protein IPQ07_13680 [Myxococcales bacterium]|nr:hypothetical protein [Myxococcales bacterium]